MVMLLLSQSAAVICAEPPLVAVRLTLYFSPFKLRNCQTGAAKYASIAEQGTKMVALLLKVLVVIDGGVVPCMVTCEQSRKASSPMLVTLLGMVTEVKE